jgi:hypothetical protein
MDTNSHYDHLSVRDGRSLRVAKLFFCLAGGGCIPYGVSAPDSVALIARFVGFHLLVFKWNRLLDAWSTSNLPYNFELNKISQFIIEQISSVTDDLINSGVHAYNCQRYVGPDQSHISVVWIPIRLTVLWECF